MGIVRSLPQVEAWLSDNSESWRQLPDSEYRALVRDWRSRFCQPIKHNETSETGDTALDALSHYLPADLILFSGVQVPEIGNLGGSCACAYTVSSLASLDHELLRQSEMISVISIIDGIRITLCDVLQRSGALLRLVPGRKLLGCGRGREQGSSPGGSERRWGKEAFPFPFPLFS